MTTVQSRMRRPKVGLRGGVPGLVGGGSGPRTCSSVRLGRIWGLTSLRKGGVLIEPYGLG